MKTEKQIRSMLKDFENDINIQKETEKQTGSFSKSNKKQLKKFIDDLQNEIDLLKWVLGESTNNLPF